MYLFSGKFVRASKYRHVYGQAAKRELCYDNIKVSSNAWDSNLIKANSKFISLNWNASGGGAFAVIPLEEVGKCPDLVPLFRGHTGVVLDTDFNPFDDRMIASSSEDGKIAIWKVPEDYSFVDYLDSNGEPKFVNPVKKLSGHLRKVGHVRFHPLAENILVSSSNDNTVKVWNIETGKPILSLNHNDLVTSFDFSYDGNRLVTTCRDKKIRIWNLRTGDLLQEGPGHGGAKNSRCVWAGTANRVITTGFSRLSDRQMGVWDADNIQDGAIGGFYNIDASAGIIMPFFDASTNLLFLAGKGDGNIRYYEFNAETNDLFSISEFQSTDPQRGFAIAPKRSVNVKEHEILKAYKTVRDTYIEPISFVVPRRAEMFQFDLYPDAPAGKPALTTEEWISGRTVEGPIVFNMESLYDDDVETVLTSSSGQNIEHSSPVVASPTIAAISKVPTSTVSPSSSPVIQQATKASIDGLLEAKDVDNLLRKAEDLDGSNSVTHEDTDANEEFAPQFKSDGIKPKQLTSAIKADPVTLRPTTIPTEPKSFANKPAATQVHDESKKVVEVEPKNVFEEAKASPSIEEKPKSASVAVAVSKAPTLKETVAKLASLVESLESQVAKLTEANAAKDAKLDLLATKIDSLLNQQL